MLPRILVISILGAVCFVLLSQFPDPSIFGIRSEPSTILFYGGSGLLAGLFTVIAIVSGILFGLQRIQSQTGGTSSRMATLAYRAALALVAIGAVLLIFATIRRLGVG